MFCVRAFARRSLQLLLQSLRSSRSSRLNSTRNSTRAATKKWLVPVSSRALTRQNLVVNGIKTPFGNVVALSLEGDLDLNHLGNPSKERGSGNVGIPYIELPPQFDSKLLHG